MDKTNYFDRMIGFDYPTLELTQQFQAVEVLSTRGIFSINRCESVLAADSLGSLI